MIKLSSSNLVFRLLAASSFLSGSLAILSILFAQTHFRIAQSSILDSHFTIVVGLSLIYLSAGLRRGKYAAWLLSSCLYGYLLVRNLWHYALFPPHSVHSLTPVLINLLIPAATLAGLVLYRRHFVSRSELLSLSIATRQALVFLLIALLYGTVGFTVMDEHDFHKEIPVPTAVHYTIDQFGLTTEHNVDPHTKRAELFVDSLAVISLGSLGYIALSLFAPIRFRLHDQSEERQLMEGLLEKYPSTSEDFFKLWPHDKAYFFNAHRTAGLAYRVERGIALVVADPAGKTSAFDNLLSSFDDYCLGNNWTPAFIHIEEKHLELYGSHGFDVQKIGEEAVIDLDKFTESVIGNKYFRHINNKFTKLGYTTEWLTPPHDPTTIRRLSDISKSWLETPGKRERRFLMGNFTPEYMNLCNIMVVLDSSKAILGFINQVPGYQASEANIDFIRHEKGSPGNINDYLLMNFIKNVHSSGFKRLNLGLSPLAGLDKEERNTLGSVLRFVYENADRFYSFSGLTRFKSKYEPDWQNRYVAYRGGLPGFIKAMNALNKAMTLKK